MLLGRILDIGIEDGAVQAPAYIPNINGCLVGDAVAAGGLRNQFIVEALGYGAQTAIVPGTELLKTAFLNIIDIIERSGNNKRVAIDLDDLVFVNEAECPAEKKLPYLADLRYNKKRIRLGFPALCRFLQLHGYDVWVFTSEFSSVDHIEGLLRRYHTAPDGIITASGRLEKTAENKKNRIREMMNKKYIRTITLYNDLMIVVNSQTGDSDQIPLEGLANEWVMDVEKAVRGLEENEE